MSAREWVPGDVALVRNHFGVWNVAICTVNLDGNVWRYGVANDEEHVAGSEARPLVVIDPEDREQVERLTRSLLGFDFDLGVDRMQAALREFANPTPPKPEEPHGLGAVVEDAEGRRYIRTSDPDCIKPWSYANNYSDHDWRDIDVVRVLSEGVTE